MTKRKQSKRLKVAKALMITESKLRGEELLRSDWRNMFPGERDEYLAMADAAIKAMKS